LTINMHEAEQLSLEQIEAFLNASQGIRFEGEAQAQIYHWIEQVLCRQEYHQQGRRARGLLRSYLAKMTGLSRAQVTRLIARYRKSGSLQPAPYRRHRFPQHYTRADIELLAAVDEAHENLSGPATRRIVEREYRLYGKREFERLASISVAHLYNLRQQPRYRERRLHYVKTRPTAVAIGERRRPDPQGQPGYLRVDTVHQGDPPGATGVYHINAVDAVTQWEIVSASARISEAWLEPVLGAMLRQFPFRILGFHSDNGSEFINQMVARLLQKLLIEQTKSRPRHSNDNGLVEPKMAP
jgi:transposase InsO family protein